MPLAKSTLDELNAYITDANGALSVGETQVIN